MKRLPRSLDDIRGLRVARWIRESTAGQYDRFGGSAAVGRKAAPGPLYGISRDVWSALAIAVTYTLRPEGVEAA
jgi:hypothetical protein